MTGRCFVIHGTMRTGSNLLEKSLAALGDTVCYGEAFNPGFTGGPRKAHLLGWTVADRDADPFGFLAALRDGAGGRIAGFRIFDGHMRAIAEHTLSEPEFARIVLRRDPLHAWVSLQIARQTGQWMLRDARRRQRATVRFDAARFCAWRDRIDRHYAWIEAVMQRAGTTALWLDYETLHDAGVMAAAARHVGSAGVPPETAPIVRQNPERLADKVGNYPELCDWLGRCPDPPMAPALPPPADVLLGRQVGLAIVPVPGPALAPALALMQRLEAQATGARAVAPARLVARPGEHFRTGLDPAVLGRELVGRTVFALVCHPALRLHGLFLDLLFSPGLEGSAARLALVQRAGEVPDLRALREGASVPEGQHRAAFEAYLDLVAQAAAGQGPLASAPARLTQMDVLEAHQAWARPDTVGRLESFAALAATLAAAAGQTALPPGQVAGIAASGTAEALPLARILDGALAARVRALHGRDLEAFGYETLPGG